ncbi:1-aminocyclopropane-1-carboxylate synthase-like protein 1 isoform X2 [Ambystoma mexicanum]|uniref:1-aminocyclopropane-1-carboxylate synthase-like protein 1 isoform X2 n=1 Tax=Ambystoma mexicanum TaxID=8296 RepID=UPI0037E7DAA9
MSCSGDQETLSARGSRISESRGILDQGFNMYLEDAYHREINPRGILNAGTSENKLCFDLLQEKLSGHGIDYLEASLLQYCESNGIKSFREEIAKFLTEYGKAPNPLSPENIVIMNGCSSIFSALSTVLLDPGDGYLIPTPYYGSINTQTELYGRIQPVHVPLFSEGYNKEEHSFQLTVGKLEMAMQSAKEKGIRVRALILINPHNPLGDIYPAKLLKECLYFGHRHKLHVIIDEIYMFSIYDDAAFTSVLALDDLPDPKRTHFMWGFSKDFAMGGIRVGVLHTTNQQVCRAVSKLASFHQCPGPIQYVLSQMLSDRDWLDNVFFPTNKRRLREAKHILITGLKEIGIPIHKSSGGLYVWADFRKFMKTQTFESEMELWWTLIGEKLYICPGQAFYCYEPGWFRLVFSDSIDNIKLCIERLQKILRVVTCPPVQEMVFSLEHELPMLVSEEKDLDSEINLLTDVGTPPYVHMEKIGVH